MSTGDQILQLLNLGGQPWWVYVLVVLVPLSILISIREFMCWFWKINKVVDRLEKIEAVLREPRERPAPRPTRPASAPAKPAKPAAGSGPGPSEL